jgi:hypothetical protein
MSFLPDDPGMDCSSEQSGGARRLGAHRRPARASIARVALAGLLLVCGFAWLGASARALTIGPPPKLPPTPPIGLGPLPTGLIALQFYQPPKPAPAPCTTKPAPIFTNKVFKDHLISGVDAGIEWQYLEPNKSGSCQFDWTPLDQVFRQADKYKKFVVLTLKPGFGTPPWALTGVTTITTAWAYHSVQVKPQALPLPWDKTYLHEWFAFLRHVARRYGTNPEFRMIDVGGPTSIAIEMSLPNWTGTPPSGTEADLNPKFPDLATTAEQYPNDSDLAMWIGEGYTPDNYEWAWRTAFHNYHQIFPHQYLSLAVLNGLPIGNNHMLDPSQITETPLTVIAAGRKYGSSFVLQEDSLASDVVTVGPPYPYVEANCGTIATGYQTQEPSIENNGAPLDSADLQAGVNDGVDFIEVYESYVLNGLAGRTKTATPADQTILAALKSAYGQLPASHGCAPLTIRATPQTATIGTQATVTAALGPASTTCPTPPGSPPLTVPCPDLLDRLNFHDNTFDPSANPLINGPFYFTADINIYENGQLLGSCNTGTSCSMTVTPRQGLTTFTADIAAPDTIPDSSQAVVSAEAAVQRTKVIPCKPQACT